MNDNFFFLNQTEEEQNQYEHYLKIIGSLSQLFSDSSTPYLYYRIAEKIFCKSFNADDLSRSDVSADAQKNSIGIGLKTFLIGNSKTYQKVAEFNADKKLYDNLSIEDKVCKIAELRNARINFTENVYSLERSLYHCVVRDKNKFLLFEEPMQRINIDNIKSIKHNSSSISFSDDTSEYSFLISKSTLTKRFNTSNFLYSFNVNMLENPLDELNKLILQKNLYSPKYLQTIYLPLYGNNKTVFTKSGLNQWNANGRHRDYDEVYIPIPAKVNHLFPNFFPARNVSFSLILPSKQNMRAKVCQEGNKALMSYSNKELGKWILRDVLKLEYGVLLTYDMLLQIGIDAVRIDKVSDAEYEINFAKTGSYENFMNAYSEDEF